MVVHFRYDSQNTSDQRTIECHIGAENRPDLVLSVIELNKLKAVADLMGKFEKFSTMLGGDKYVTMSYLKVMVTKLKAHLKVTPSDS